MPDQILVLREIARAGPGNGGRPELPPGSKLAVYGDSLSNRVTWQPTVAAYFGIPWTNFAVGSTTAVDRGGSSGANVNNLNNFINLHAATVGINTIWFGYNDWAQSDPPVDIGDDTVFATPVGTRDRTVFKGALSYIVERLYTAKPEALHILVTVPGSQYDNNRTREFVQAAIDVANYHAVPYINMFTGAGINRFNFSSFLTDHVHVGTDMVGDGTAQQRNRRGALRWANVFINKIEEFYRTTAAIVPTIAELSAEAGPLEPPPAWAVEQE